MAESKPESKGHDVRVYTAGDWGILNFGALTGASWARCETEGCGWTSDYHRTVEGARAAAKRHLNWTAA